MSFQSFCQSLATDPQVSLTPITTVKTVGYYTRDKDFNIIGTGEGLQQLNGYWYKGMSLERRGYKDKGPFEDNMESLLNYIRPRKGLLNTCDVVTFRNVVKKIASGTDDMEVQVFFYKGKYWIRNMDDTEANTSYRGLRNLGRGAAFADHTTVIPHQQGVADKSVNLVTLTNGMRILLSAELDCSYEVNDRRYNVEKKVTSYEPKIWFQENAHSVFWQCFFGNVGTLVLGEGDDSIRNVHLVDPRYIIHPVSCNDGDQRLCRFTSFLPSIEVLKNEGDSVVLSRVGDGEFDDKSQGSKRKVVMEYFKDTVLNVFN